MSATGRPAEARASYEESLAILRMLAEVHPAVAQYYSDLAASYIDLGNLLSATGRPAEARASYEESLAILRMLAEDHPTVTEYQGQLAISHNNFGVLLSATGRPPEARAAYETALAIRRRHAEDHPELPAYSSDLGNTLDGLAVLDLKAREFAAARDRLREAIEWQRKALADNPRNPAYRQFLRKHYTNLLEAAGGLADADVAAEARSGLTDLDTSDPRLAAFDARLAAILEGEAHVDNAERLALAQRAYDTKRYAAAARLWAEALESDPTLAESRQNQHPYNAACAAALAAAGPSADDPPPDDDAKADLRRRALGWLRAELAAWSKVLDSDDPQARAAVAPTLQHWRQDSDLVGVRDPEALAALPDDEGADWRGLWDVVAMLIKKVDEP